MAMDAREQRTDVHRLAIEQVAVQGHVWIVQIDGEPSREELGEGRGGHVRVQERHAGRGIHASCALPLPALPTHQSWLMNQLDSLY